MLISLAVFLAMTPFLVGQLGTGQYGVLALLSSVQAIAGSIDLGLVAGGMLILGRTTNDSAGPEAGELYRELLSAFFYLGAAIAAVIWIFALPLVHALRLEEAVNPQEAVALIRIAAVSVVVGFMTTAASIVPRALEQFPHIALVQTAANLSVAAGVVVLVVSGFGLKALALWGLFVGSVALGYYLIWNRHTISQARLLPVIRFRQVGTVARFSLSVFLTQTSSALTYHADKFILAALLGPTAVTFYAIAVSIGAQLVAVGAATSAFVFPRVVVLHRGQSDDQIRQLYLSASRYLLLAIGPLLVPAVLLVPDLLRLWLGGEAQQTAAAATQILLAGYFVTVFSIVPCQVYNGMGETRLALAYAAVGTAANIVLCLVLIPGFGLAGAAIASFVGMLPSIMLMASVEKLLGFPWLRIQTPLYLRLLLVLVLQAVCVLLFRDYVTGWRSLAMVGSAAWALFYFVWFTGPLATDEDRKLARILLSARKV